MMIRLREGEGGKELQDLNMETYLSMCLVRIGILYHFNVWEGLCFVEIPLKIASGKR